MSLISGILYQIPFVYFSNWEWTQVLIWRPKPSVHSLHAVRDVIGGYISRIADVSKYKTLFISADNPVPDICEFPVLHVIQPVSLVVELNRPFPLNDFPQFHFIGLCNGG